jgi:hypothetical protein
MVDVHRLWKGVTDTGTCLVYAISCLTISAKKLLRIPCSFVGQNLGKNCEKEGGQHFSGNQNFGY